ncbi:MAG: RHS repeat-associated core domain-containing protein [Planctomycetota bacterium]
MSKSTARLPAFALLANLTLATLSSAQVVEILRSGLSATAVQLTSIGPTADYVIYEGIGGAGQWSVVCVGTCSPPVDICVGVDAGTMPPGMFLTSGNPVCGPNGAAVTFAWLPGYCQAGWYAVTFTYQVAGGTLVEQAVSFEVINVNRFPTLTSSPIGIPSAFVGDLVEVTLIAADADETECGDDSVAVMVNQVPGGSLMNEVWSWDTTGVAPGFYLAEFVAADTEGGVSNHAVFIFLFDPPCIPPTATFVASPDSGDAPLQVAFTSQSTGTPPLSYSWDLNGDSISDSTAASPTYSYLTPGSFAVTLTVTNACGSAVLRSLIEVANCTGPTELVSKHTPAGRDLRWNNRSHPAAGSPPYERIVIARTGGPSEMSWELAGHVEHFVDSTVVAGVMYTYTVTGHCSMDRTGATATTIVSDGVRPPSPDGSRSRPQHTVTSPKGGDPVNLATGAFALRVEDVRIPGRGGLDFVWDRTYDSNTIYEDMEFGTAWTADYLQRLVRIDIPGQGSEFVRSDCNNDAAINLGDPITILSFLFSSGAIGACEDACDSNDDGGLDIADAIFALTYLFAGGSQPPSPFPKCGPDPGGDVLECADYSGCPAAAYDLRYFGGNGRIDDFEYLDGVEWRVNAHYFRELLHVPTTAEFHMVRAAALRYVFHDFTTGAASGALKRIEDRLGNRIEFMHTHGWLTSATDTFGRIVHFLHDEVGRIDRVVDFSGRTWDYHYDEGLGGTSGRLATVLLPEVTDTSTGNDFAGDERRSESYTYDSSESDPFRENRLLTLVAPNGNVSLENQYSDEPGSLGKVIAQRYGSGWFQLHYETISQLIGDETATMLAIINDRRGAVVEYRMNELGNLVSFREYTGLADPMTPTTLTDNRPGTPLRPTDPPYFESTAEYDDDGRLLRYTFPRGNSASLVYNAAAAHRYGRLNIVGKSFESGSLGGTPTVLSTMTTYEPNFELVKTTTDARGHTTTYFYDYEEASLGDLNQDGETGDNRGLLVRVDREPVTIGLSANAGPVTVSSLYQYNGFGDLTRVIDPEGRTTDIRYHPETDPDGDGADLIAGKDLFTGGYPEAIVRDPAGKALTTSYKFDPAGNTIQAINSRGHVTTFEYNAANQLVRIVGPAMAMFDDGASYEQARIYDPNGRIVALWRSLHNGDDDSIADTPGFERPDHLEQLFTYDEFNNCTSETYELGLDPEFTDESLTYSYAYDASQNLVAVVHPNGDMDTWEYDERDLLLRATVGANDGATIPSTVEYDYDGNLNVVEVRYPNPLRREIRAYDPFDRVATLHETGIDSTTELTYDANSNLLAMQIFGPWDSGQPVVELVSTEWDFDELDRPYRTREHLFRRSDHSGLQAGALTESVAETEFDRAGLPVRIVNAHGNEFQATYDAVGRVSQVIDPAGNIRQLVYGDGENVTAEISYDFNADGTADIFTLQYAFDELDRIRTRIDDNGDLTTFVLDSRGLVTADIDPEGRITRRRFDGRSRLYRERRTIGPGVEVDLQLGWTARDQQEYYRDGLGRVTSYVYDSHNRLVAQTNADGTTQLRSWDVESNLTQLTRENGEVVEFSYDAGNRPIERRYRTSSGQPPALVDQFDYDGTSQLTKVRQIGGPSESYIRDSRGLVLEQAQSIPGQPNRRFVADRDALGNLTQLGYPGGRTLTFDSYNPQELVTALTTDDASFDFTYDGLGRLSAQLPSNGVDLHLDYDNVKRVIAHRFGPEAARRWQLDETYDAAGHRRAEELLDYEFGEAGARVYALDSHYRAVGFIRALDSSLLPGALLDFTQVEAGDGQDYESVQYDFASNAVSVSLATGTHFAIPNSMNQIDGIGSLVSNCTWDQNGRLLTFERGGEGFALTWNLRDELIGIERTSPSSEVIAEYSYYPSGMRASKVAGGAEQFFYGPSATVCEIYDSTGAIEAEFVHKSDEDQPLVMFQDVDGSPSTGSLGGREPYYYHQNPRGDVIALTDAQGAVVERFDYDLFGSPRHLTPDYSPLVTGLTPNPFLFGGAFWDAESGLYAMRARYYDPQLRRFLSRDPEADDSLGNLYSPFENHAGQFRDPSGRRKSKIEKPAGVTNEQFNLMVTTIVEYLNELAKGTGYSIAPKENGVLIITHKPESSFYDKNTRLRADFFSILMDMQTHATFQLVIQPMNDHPSKARASWTPLEHHATLRFNPFKDCYFVRPTDFEGERRDEYFRDLPKVPRNWIIAKPIIVFAHELGHIVWRFRASKETTGGSGNDARYRIGPGNEPSFGSNKGKGDLMEGYAMGWENVFRSFLGFKPRDFYRAFITDQLGGTCLGENDCRCGSDDKLDCSDRGDGDPYRKENTLPEGRPRYRVSDMICPK